MIRSRFEEAVWRKRLVDIVIVGLGNIGSWTSLFLSRIGHNLILIDPDKVEEHNIGGQFYTASQLEEYKVNATVDLISEFSRNTPFKIYANKVEQVNINKYGNSVVISAVDNMAARKYILEEFLKSDSIYIFIDGRSEMELFEVYILNKRDPKFKEHLEYYRSSLFDDSDIPDLPCNLKSTTHCGANIASMIVANLNNILYNKFTGDNILPTPIKIRFHLAFMNFNVIYYEDLVNSEENLITYDTRGI